MTQHYVGTKIIEAWQQERDGVAGYAVKYADGYTSWSPAEAFEAAYLPLGHIGNLPPHVQRMVAELAQLSDRIMKLDGFVITDQYASLEESEREDLAAQARAMTMYQEVLRRRVARATGEGR